MSGDIADKLAALGPNHTTNEAFDAVDMDQSGTISRAEFAPVYEHGRQQEREKTKALAENKLLKWMVVLLILAVLIVIGVTSGVTTVVVEANKESHIENSEMVDLKGGVVATAQSMVKTPVMQSGKLPPELVAGLDSLSFWAELEGTWVFMTAMVSLAYKVSEEELTVKTPSGDLITINSLTETGSIEISNLGKTFRIAKSNPAAAERRRLGKCSADDCAPMSGFEATHETYCKRDVFAHGGCLGGAHGCQCKDPAGGQANSKQAAGSNSGGTETELKTCQTELKHLKDEISSGGFKPKNWAELKKAISAWCHAPSTLSNPVSRYNYLVEAYYGTVDTWDVTGVKDMPMSAQELSSILANIRDGTHVCFAPASALILRFAVHEWCLNGKEAKAKYGDITLWDVTMLKDLSKLFDNLKEVNYRGADHDHKCNPDISSWDVSSATNMYRMFYEARAFNRDLSKWDVSSVDNMEEMFEDCWKFNGDVDSWDTSSVVTMKRMFMNAKSFNRDLSKWKTGMVTNMEGMFENTFCDIGSSAYKWHQRGEWDGYGCKLPVFNGALSNWNTNAVTNMGSMFKGATSFNQNLKPWNTDKVTNMAGMLEGPHERTGLEGAMSFAKESCPNVPPAVAKGGSDRCGGDPICERYRFGGDGEPALPSPGGVCGGSG
jgi:surface protein